MPSIHFLTPSLSAAHFYPATTFSTIEYQSLNFCSHSDPSLKPPILRTNAKSLALLWNNKPETGRLRTRMSEPLVEHFFHLVVRRFPDAFVVRVWPFVGSVFDSSFVFRDCTQHTPWYFVGDSYVRLLTMLGKQKVAELAAALSLLCKINSQLAPHTTRHNEHTSLQRMR